jgi:DNA adenine methylase
MYRLNSQGRFNVPYGGGLRTPNILWERDLILQASKSLHGVRLRVSDFARTMANAGPGDVVYCDPTYTVAHNNNAFIRYNEKNFSWKDQMRLAASARRAAARGATVLVSNAHHSSIIELYRGAEMRLFTRKSLVSRDASRRRDVRECLFVLTGAQVKQG